jgi:hypothetical protein
MAIREVRAKGLDYLALATSLLQRARLSDAEAGVWEAGDLQWWWRTPRRSDSLTEGLERLAMRGARRLKVGFGTDAARGLYLGAGFRVTSVGNSYRWSRPSNPPVSEESH